MTARIGNVSCCTLRSPLSSSVASLPAADRASGAADVAAGKALAEGCAGCHGADGISQMPLTPSLAGQPDEFVQWQLVYFRSGDQEERGDGADRRGVE